MAGHCKSRFAAACRDDQAIRKCRFLPEDFTEPCMPLVSQDGACLDNRLCPVLSNHSSGAKRQWLYRFCVARLSHFYPIPKQSVDMLREPPEVEASAGSTPMPFLLQYVYLMLVVLSEYVRREREKRIEYLQVESQTLGEDWRQSSHIAPWRRLVVKRKVLGRDVSLGRWRSLLNLMRFFAWPGRTRLWFSKLVGYVFESVSCDNACVVNAFVGSNDAASCLVVLTVPIQQVPESATQSSSRGPPSARQPTTSHHGSRHAA